MNGKTIMEVVLEAAQDARVDKITMAKLEDCAKLDNGMIERICRICNKPKKITKNRVKTVCNCE